jgi:anti-sigma B factor antagonist
MQIEERRVGNVTVLDMSGRMTLAQGDSLFKDKIHSLVNQGQTRILVNMAHVAYVDSAGLGELVGAYTTVKRAGGTLKLQNLTARIKELLTITKLSTIFEIFDQEQDAIKSFS